MGRETALVLLLSCGVVFLSQIPFNGNQIHVGFTYLSFSQSAKNKYDWMEGSWHRDHCHLFEVDRKLSDEFKSIEPFGPWLLSVVIRQEQQSDSERRQKSRYRNQFGMIQAAVFQNGKELEYTPNLGIFIKLVGQGPNYDHRSFVIEKVVLIPWTPHQYGAKLMTGFCLLPGGGIPPPYTSEANYQFAGTALPPGFDLHRYITHVNSQLQHNALPWAAEPPPEWLRYMLCHSAGFQYTNFSKVLATSSRVQDRGIMMFVVIKCNGTTLLYKYNNNISSALCSNCPAAIAKVDLTEFKKLLDDPSWKLCMIPAYKCLLPLPIISFMSL
ncbi:hypothetical protein K438DRAFT_2078958 [Mycena galopus ATCC 62051]|nr:hypothetical protein K438DRAFT_2078958 [Mycena galopus ATCC 62051]